MTQMQPERKRLSRAAPASTGNPITVPIAAAIHRL